MSRSSGSSWSVDSICCRTKPSLLSTTVSTAVLPSVDQPTTRSPLSSKTVELRSSVSTWVVCVARLEDLENCIWPTSGPEQRSEERRVGKEWGTRGEREQEG